MEIKPIRPANDLTSLARANQPASFRSTTAETSETEPLASGQPGAGVTAQFQKADLQDPAKVDQMLSQCAGDLLQSALGGVKGQMPQADKQFLTDWLQNDPSIRGKLMNYLERVLT